MANRRRAIVLSKTGTYGHVEVIGKFLVSVKADDEGVVVDVFGLAEHDSSDAFVEPVTSTYALYSEVEEESA